jgi:superoxide reductase
MAELNKIYKCNLCGNIVSVIVSGAGDLVCCGEDMEMLEEKTIEQEGKEKHVPVVSIDGNKVVVKVGSIDHPMEDKHYIALIQIMKNNKVIAGKRLEIGEKPEAVFYVDETDGIYAREICNVHGLWRS